MNFGEYLSSVRKDRNMTALNLAKELGVSAVYISDIQRNRKPSPSKKHLDKIAEILNLRKDERDTLYDLAGKSKNIVSEDLPEYIMANNIVRTALRTAKENDVPDKEWEEFISRINSYKNNGDENE